MNFPQRGLYAITRTHHEFNNQAQLLSEVSSAIAGGAVVVQYRDKNSNNAPQYAQALLGLCHAHNVPLIINDDVALAKTIGADGVHLGKDDGDIERARAVLGKEAIIGVSCYNSVERALTAQAQGATYVAFGRFFPSNSKPLAAPAQLETLIEAKQRLTVPIVAIGGILPSNGLALLNAGADLLAVIGGLFDNEAEESARAYHRLFD
ncbi:MAG: thiamine phosphate synthase [Methylococcaceae bacterium]